MPFSAGGEAGAETFADLARALLGQADVQHTLQKIVDLAVDTIEGCDHAGISFLKGGKGSTPAASDSVPPQVDAIQYETGEGPCLSAIREHDVFESPDLRLEARWPQFASRAQRETGISSMLCFRLFVDGDTLGALNLYSKAVDAFDERSRTAGLVYAAHAAIALSTAIHSEQMDEALKSRDLIGQAKGILMAREGVTADQAFDMLRRASQRLNVKLRDLAGQMVESTEKPPASAPSPAGHENGESST
jgi:transcriptional regulator with GAF, ATPase, and Fis domain